MSHPSLVCLSMEQYCLLAKGARGLALADLIQRVTSDPQIFAFGELLTMPHIQELGKTEQASSLALLQLFSTGMWQDYTANSSLFPPLTSAQQLKLKQLTVVSIATHMKTVPYDHLMQQLGVSNVRELEDLLISDCFYPKLISGKLDQKARALVVEDAVGRDVQPERLPEVVAGLQHWLQQSMGLLGKLEDRIERIHSASEAAAQRQKDQDLQIEEAKNQLKANVDFRNSDAVAMDDAVSSLEYIDEDRAGGRPKRRR